MGPERAGARNWDARAVRAKENSRSGIHLGKKILTHSNLERKHSFSAHGVEQKGGTPKGRKGFTT